MKNKSKSSLLPTPSTNNTLSANKSETEVRCPEYYNRSNGRIANDLKHKSDNSLSSSSCNYSNLRRGPRSNVYSNSILPPYMEDSYAASGDAFVAGAYDEKLVPIAQTNGPNSRGEGISLKEQHFCVAEHLDKVQSVKLPGSVLLVEPGQERKALVSFIETPGKFYVNIIEENTAHMEQLEEELCAHYSQVNNLVSLVTIEEARYHLGEFVAAKWKSDGRWYRARVIDWNVCVKNSKIAILYVDHGNLDLVPLDYIQPLDPHFTHCATMAQPCHLANLAPVSSVGWSEAAIEMFSQFCNKTPHEVFYLTFQPSNNNDTSSSWSVVIRNEGGECINDLLVSSGFAIHTKVNGHATNPTPVPPTPAPTPPADSKDKGLAKTAFKCGEK
ncbi:tudor domain-containing protein 1-like isoform X2 [Diaphorina citri]|uniref:Tudor domain-containing protein 1-like isoform X2 n=1 Tax=Diaphorina citri TaxID=121845 RepID=A0A1S3D5W9_DIACI|nr:tudor domain-containing protein 1-like isoform X2 [Diaphorina citri]